MNISEMSLEEMVTRWEDRREIQNLMGRYTYALLLKQEKDIFDTYWCKKAERPSLGFNDGYYIGYEAIKGYYEALHQKNQLRTKLILEDFADQAEGKTEEELYGCGVLEHKPLANQIIEIAKDGQTAKGFWYVVGKDDEYGESGPLSYWTFGMFGVDFVWEDNEWRIWHLTYVEDVHHPCGESWTDAPKERAAMPIYQPMADFKMPEPTISCSVHELYSPTRKFTKTLPLPESYPTFADTFSYGR
jgi:hypothetical protein